MCTTVGLSAADPSPELQKQPVTVKAFEWGCSALQVVPHESKALEKGYHSMQSCVQLPQGPFEYVLVSLSVDEPGKPAQTSAPVKVFIKDLAQDDTVKSEEGRRAMVIRLMPVQCSV